MRNGNGKIKKDDLLAAIEYPQDPAKRAEVIRIISKLPVNQRIALLSYYYGGLNEQEVAASMQVPRRVAENYLEHARQKVLKELGMNNENTLIAPGGLPDVPVLKQIFDRYVEDTISDEQLRRVLEPVLRMIDEGEFDRPRLHRYEWLLKPLAIVMIVVAMVVIVIFSQR